MKIAVCSDLHLEFRDLVLENPGVDVLVLSGDIMVVEPIHTSPNGEKAKIFTDFLRRCAETFPNVVMVMGNHEFYQGRWVESVNHLKQATSQYPNFHVLEMDTVTIDNVHFVGGTLWTDCNKVDPLTMQMLPSMMSDYRVIRHDTRGFGKLKPEDTVKRHRETLDYFSKTLAEIGDEPTVVVTHHPPSDKSITPEYANQFHMNGAFCSNLSEFILDHPQIKVWTCGHVHNRHSYCIGGTRIVCNPRGYYGYEMMVHDFKLEVVEV